MEPIFDLNPSDYATTPPGLDVAGTIALGRRLLSVVPGGLSPQAEVVRSSLGDAIAGLERGYTASLTADPGVKRRPIDRGTDNTWACIKARLEPWTWLLDDADKDVAPAKELFRKLFPGGTLAFVQLDYNAQWAEASWRIELLQREGLLPLLRKLTGELFVRELLDWHKRYTEMLGVHPAQAPAARPKPARKNAAAGSRAAEVPPSLSVGELRRRALQAIVGWQLTLVTLHLAGNKEARAALQVTDEFRQRALAGARESAEPGGAHPTPPVPTPAPAP